MHASDESKNHKINRLITLFKEGDMGVVIPEATKLIEEYSSGISYNILALAHKRLGNYALAQDIYTNLLVSNPNNILFLGNLGNIYSEVGELDKAEECFKKSLAINPKNFESCKNRYNKNKM